MKSISWLGRRKKRGEGQGVKKAPERKVAATGEDKCSSSFEFDDAFKVNYTIPTRRSY